jgi:hypothetical protein
MTLGLKLIGVAYRVMAGQHTFYSADMRVAVAHPDRTEAAAQMVRLGKELSARNIHVYITAYDRLGPELKALRKDLGEGAWMTVAYELGGTPQPRAEVTLGDFLERLPDLDPAAVAVAMQNLKIARQLTCLFPGDPTPEPPPPVYASWGDYLARTTRGERLDWCTRKAKKANQQRLLSDAPAIRLTREDVWNVMAKARGRCAYCGSLAVEYRPSDPQTGAPITWALVGRRIGSLGHTQARFFGGGNEASNLNWSCLWCNTWVSERRQGATDHGGFHPKED